MLFKGFVRGLDCDCDDDDDDDDEDGCVGRAKRGGSLLKSCDISNTVSTRLLLGEIHWRVLGMVTVPERSTFGWSALIIMFGVGST